MHYFKKMKFTSPPMRIAGAPMTYTTREQAFALLTLHVAQEPVSLNQLELLYGVQNFSFEHTMETLLHARLVRPGDEPNTWTGTQPATAEEAALWAEVVRTKPAEGDISHLMGYISPGCTLYDCEYALKCIDENFNCWTAGMNLYVKLILNFLEAQATRHTQLPASDNWKFVNLVLITLCFSVFSQTNIRLALALTAKAETVAEANGNERFRPFLFVLRLYLTSLFEYPTEASLEEAARQVNAVNSLDDPAIGKLMPWLFGMLHFMRGEYQGALDCYRRSTAQPHWWYRRLFDLQELNTLFSANYLAQYHLAVGIGESARHTAALAGETTVSLFYLSQQCFLHLRIGDKEKALAGINTVVQSPGYAGNYVLSSQCTRLQALQLYMEGEVEAGHRLLNTEVRRALAQGMDVAPFYDPFMLDMIAVFERQGLPPIPRYDLDEILMPLLHSANTHLRGAALRVRALREQTAGAPATRVVELLRQSLRCLLPSGDPRELALTAHVLSQNLEHAGRTDEARRLRRELAHATSNALHADTDYAEASILCLKAPADFASRLAHEGTEPLFGPLSETSLTGRDILARCHTAFHSFPAHENFADMCLALIKIAQNELDAEQAALFHLCENKQLRCEGALNITPTELESSGMRAYKEWLQQIAEGGTTSSFIHQDFGLCLVLDVGDEGRTGGTGRKEQTRPWLLNLRNHQTEGLAGRLTHFEVQDLARLFAAELRTCLRMDSLRDSVVSHQYARLKNIVSLQDDDTMSPLLGEGMGELMKKALQVSATDAPILLWGETGVGKEVMARQIHDLSECPGPFIAIHPASMPETLFESECFGHERGAFTGAVKQKIGLFELADRGTLFIDEVGEMSPVVQTKLLRVLQEKRFMRVGGTHEITSHFRLITATNRDLWREVLEGRFRQDLLYRIAVVPLKIPALRERPQDILPLVTAFIRHFSRRHGKHIPPVSTAQQALLCGYSWPGNIRELRNVVERAILLHDSGEALHFEVSGNNPSPAQVLDAPPSVPHTAPSNVDALFATLPKLHELEEHYLRHVMQLTGGRVLGPTGAAARLGMKHTTLYAKLRKYGIRSSGKE